MSEPSERDDLEQFLTSNGWLRFQAYAKTEWGAVAYAKKLKDAVVEAADKRTDPAQAVLRVNAAHDAVNDLMLWPVARAKTLQGLDTTRQRNAEPPLSRRGTL